MSKFNCIYRFLFCLFVIVTISLVLSSNLVAFVSSESSIEANKSAEIPKSLLPQLVETLGGANSKYHILEQEGLYISKTPSHGITTTFHKDQVKFERGENVIEMHLVSNYENIKPEKVLDNKIEYKRGNITEWYVNSPYGVEQGFTVNEKPQRTGNEVSISIELDMSSGATVVEGDNGKSVNFVDGDENHILNYSGLYAFDSTGKELPSYLRLKDNDIIEIRVDDRNAQYPITIDPFVQSQRVTASDPVSGAVDDFAWSVSIDGDRAIVGIPGWDGSAGVNQGAAIIYERNVSGVWIATPTLFPPTPGSGGSFGRAVSISGDWALVGEPNDDQSFANDGAAHFFQRVSGVWVYRRTVSHALNDLAEDFGFSVSISGNRAIIGDPLFGSGGTNNQGAVFVYQRSGTNWNPSPSNPILTSDSDRNDQFGFSVSISGDWFIAGAPIDSNNGGFTDFIAWGAVYFYQRSGSTSWVQRQKVIGDDDGNDLGFSVSMDGNIAIAGALGERVTGGSSINAGAAYIFERSGIVWGTGGPDTTTETRLTASNQFSGHRFGSGVAIFGDIVVVGANTKDSTGSAYIYQRTAPGVWGNEQEVSPSDPSNSALFGQSVAISGETIFIGSPQADDVAAEQGAGYFFDVGAMLTIVKETNPDGATGFGFAGTGFPATCGLDGSFTLDDNNSAGTSFIDCILPVGSYTVQETDPSGHTPTNINCVGTTNFTETADSITVNLIEDDSVVCTFTNTINRRLTITNNGGGTVTSNPAGINCGSDCTENYISGTVVTLTPTPVAGFRFDGWTGSADCSDGSVTMNNGRNCTASFVVIHELTVSHVGTGTGTVTSSPVGINCGSGGSDCDEDYDEGAVITLTPVADADSYFTRFASNCSSGVITLNADFTCFVRFTLKPILTITKTGSGTGTVTTAPAGINCGADCTEAYDPGSEVVITASAGTNSDFVGFTGAGCTTGTVTLGQADITCTAEFALKKRTITVSKVGSGTVTSAPAGINCGADCTGDYDHGTVVTLTPTAASGFRFDSWTGSGDCTDGSLTMNNNRNCTANFVQLFPLTVSVTGNGTVTSAPAGINCGSDCTEVYDSGTSVTLTATPLNSDSVFISWGSACSGAGSNPSATVSMSSARTCTATFGTRPVTLTVAVVDDIGGTMTSDPPGINCGSGGSDCTAVYDVNTTVRLITNPDPGYIFSGNFSQDFFPCSLIIGSGRRMTRDFSCTIGFEPAHPLTVNVTEGGMVTSAPEGVNDCGSNCEEHPEGTSVTLTANPLSNHEFVSWGGDCSIAGSNPSATVNMSSAQTCTATFDNDQPDPPSIFPVLTNMDPGTTGLNILTSMNHTPGGETTFVYGFNEEVSPADDICPGLELGIRNARILTTDTVDEFGDVTIGVNVPASIAGVTVKLQSIDMENCSASNVTTETFNIPVPDPEEIPVLDEMDPGTVGLNTLTSTNNTPGGQVRFVYGFNEEVSNGDSICSGLQVGIKNHRFLSTAVADQFGNVTINVNVPPNAEGITVKLQSVDVSSCIPGNIVTQTL